MIKAMFTAATGMSAQSTNIDTVANNLANVNTNGFKRNHLDFQDLLYVNEVTPGATAVQGQQMPSGLQVGSGVRVAGTPKIFTQGSLVNTGNNFDLAIEGQGFLGVTTPSGLQYTRDGGLQVSPTGTLVTSDGFPISPQVTIPQDALSVSIGSDGTVSVTSAGSTATTQAGQLTLYRFSNPAGLSAEGRNLFAESSSSGTATSATPGQNGTGLLRQGFLEQSNVESVTELVNLILAQRAFEFNTRSIQAADQMLQRVSQINT